MVGSLRCGIAQALRPVKLLGRREGKGSDDYCRAFVVMNVKLSEG